jgi:hypothetical protein
MLPVPFGGRRDFTRFSFVRQIEKPQKEDEDDEDEAAAKKKLQELNDRPVEAIYVSDELIKASASLEAIGFTDRASNLACINVCLGMSLASLSLRGMFSSSSLAVVSQPRHGSTLTRLSSACCHLSNPACLESLSCLSLSLTPVLAPSTNTLSSLCSLSQLSVSSKDDAHGHAMANMYGFHI